jgi:hypothetical protein
MEKREDLYKVFLVSPPPPLLRSNFEENRASPPISVIPDGEEESFELDSKLSSNTSIVNNSI